ncbi:MAG: Si-specific NAD(P)(+) transhydrogenase [Pseudomonadales bacterium]
MKRYDLFVIGSGPAGQKAAIQAAKAGARVAVCEQLREIGGACVHQGTIPSKALRERALQRLDAVGARDFEAVRGVPIAELIGEVGDVVRAHDRYMSDQLRRNGIEILHGRASFESAEVLRVRTINGNVDRYATDFAIIASGSRPRQVASVPVDHEHVLDSDSILSLAYLPRSLAVLGGGVIACEYASIFALLGVEVTLIDRADRPLGFLDRDLTDRFLAAFAALGGTYRGATEVRSARFNGISSVAVDLADGDRVEADKVLCALGRVSQLGGLNVEALGVVVDERGLVRVNEHYQTDVPNIYAAGDVVGPPSLASSAMEQGRHAACHILGLDSGRLGDWIPAGIYAVPELASVGLTEAEARRRHPGSVVGYADFREIARGHIAGRVSGMLKLVVAPDGRVLGVHVIGAQATDLVHIGQMALIHDAGVDVFIENVFNFPTYAESYRVAALHAASQLHADARAGDARSA